MIAELILDLGLSNPPFTIPPLPPADMSTAAPYEALITSEHDQKPNYMALVHLLCESMGDITAGIQTIQPAFDLDFAVGVQLDILGLWIGQSRVIPNVLVQGYFGFSDDIAALPFGELTNPSIGGVWYELGSATSGSTVLEDDNYRQILRARIIRNQSAGSLVDIENSLQFVFGASCRVIDQGNLNLSLIVTTPITTTEEALIRNLDLLPRPAGVSIGSITFVGSPLVPSPLGGISIDTINLNWQQAPTWGSQRPRRM